MSITDFSPSKIRNIVTCFFLMPGLTNRSLTSINVLFKKIGLLHQQNQQNRKDEYMKRFGDNDQLPPPPWIFKAGSIFFACMAIVPLLVIIAIFAVKYLNPPMAELTQDNNDAVVATAFIAITIFLLISRYCNPLMSFLSWNWRFADTKSYTKAQTLFICCLILLLICIATVVLDNGYRKTKATIMTLESDKDQTSLAYTTDEALNIYEMWFAHEQQSSCNLDIIVVESGRQIAGKEKEYKHAVYNQITDKDKYLGSQDVNCLELILKVDHDAHNFVFIYSGMSDHPCFIKVRDKVNPHRISTNNIHTADLEMYMDVPTYINMAAHKVATLVSIIKLEQIKDAMQRLIAFISNEYSQKSEHTTLYYDERLEILREEQNDLYNYTILIRILLYGWLLLPIYIPIFRIVIHCFLLHRINKKARKEGAKIREKEAARAQKNIEQEEHKEQQRKLNKQQIQAKKEEAERLVLEKEEKEEARRAQICECIENAFKNNSVIDQFLSGIDHWPDNRKKELYQNLKQSFALPMTADEQAAHEKERVMYKAIGHQEDSIFKKINIFSTVDRLRKLVTTEIRDTNAKKELQDKLDTFEQKLKKEWL